jgi:N-acetylmuramoyl-L-alanine amidase
MKIIRRKNKSASKSSKFSTNQDTEESDNSITKNLWKPSLKFLASMTLITVASIYIHTTLTTINLYRDANQELLTTQAQNIEEIERMSLVLQSEVDRVAKLNENIIELDGVITNLNKEIETNEETIEQLELENEELGKRLTDIRDRIASRTLVSGQVLSDSDITLLAQMTHDEGRGKTHTGRVGVVNVVFNRMNDPRFPDTVQDVIMAPGQFDGRNRFHTLPVTEESLEAVYDAIAGINPVSDSLFFFNQSIAACQWQTTRQFVAFIDGHTFSR